MPFNISTPGITISKKPAGMRKFDDDITNRLRVIEKLHYHSAHNPKYVSELKNALIKTGIIAEKIKKTLKIIIMKKLMLLLVVLLAVSCSGTKDSDYLFEDVIDCDYHFDAELKPLKEDSFKVISVTYGYIGAIVKGKKEYYYIGMYNEGFYDGMTIKKPDGEEFVIVGTYKYKTPQSGVKTIKIIETCPADIFK